jgi:hypothetical protein
LPVAPGATNRSIWNQEKDQTKISIKSTKQCLPRAEGGSPAGRDPGWDQAGTASCRAPPSPANLINASTRVPRPDAEAALPSDGRTVSPLGASSGAHQTGRARPHPLPMGWHDRRTCPDQWHMPMRAGPRSGPRFCGSTRSGRASSPTKRPVSLV